MSEHAVLISLLMLIASIVTFFLLRSGENLRFGRALARQVSVHAGTLAMSGGPLTNAGRQAMRRPLGCGWKG
jgi:hypothetical protein